MLAGFGTAILGFILKLLTKDMVESVLGFFERKANSEVELVKLETLVTIEVIKAHLEDKRISADLQKEKMHYWPFWLILSIAISPMMVKWVMINLYDVFWCADCMFAQDWTIAAYQAPFDKWAETAFTWIFGPLAGGAGIGLGLSLGSRK